MTMRMMYLFCEGVPDANAYFLPAGAVIRSVRSVMEKEVYVKRGLGLGAFNVIHS